MTDYKGQTVQMATTLNRGVIDDHLDVSPDFNSDFKARDTGNPRLRLYSGFVRRDFNVANGPEHPTLLPRRGSESSRNYQRMSIEFQDLPLDEALERAREIALAQNIVLYLEREFPTQLPSPCYREIDWHPNGWQPREG